MGDFGQDPRTSPSRSRVLARSGEPWRRLGTRVRIVLALVNELRRRGGRLGVAGLCIGGGQGMAMLEKAF